MWVIELQNSARCLCFCSTRLLMSEKGCHTHKHKLSHKHTLTYTHTLTQPRHLLSYKKRRMRKKFYLILLMSCTSKRRSHLNIYCCCCVRFMICSSLWLVSVKSNLDLQLETERCCSFLKLASLPLAAAAACAKCLMQFAGAQTQ